MPDVPEDYYYSSLEADEIEDRLLHVVTYHKAMHLSDEEKALFRTNIGAGTTNTGLIILGYFDTLEDLRESLTVLPKAGDAYGIGTSAPYDIYIYDGYHAVWINNGPLNPGNTTFDDNTVSSSKGWTSNKILTELTTLDGNKQAKITTSGILKGNGSGGISAAVAGTDYLTPTTNYSPVVTKNSNYTISASDSGKTIIIGSSTSSDVTITIDQTVLGSLPFGAEIAFVKDNSPSSVARLKIVGVGFGNAGVWTSPNANGVYTVIPERYGMITLKKMFNNNNVMMLFGNVEVVS